MRKNTVASFWERVDCSGGSDACWPWRGAVGSDGYRHVRYRGKQMKAHRLAMILSGNDPWKLDALHKCVGNRVCCNPAHLYAGTDADNAKDREEQGRTARGERNGARTKPETRPRGEAHGRRTKPEATARGARHGNAKYSEEIVRRARALHAAGESYRLIAAALGIPRGLVGGIVRGEAWRHVEVSNG